MEYFETQQVCLNGHQITENYEYPPDRKAFCDLCGEKTINTCPNCNAGVKSDWDVPEYCHNCGKPYPWTGKKREMGNTTFPSNMTDPVLLVENICKRFPLIVKQLCSRYNSRPTLDITDEYDVQDLVHALLRLFFDDIRPEEWTPSYAGKSSRMDFLLKNESIVIETKKTRNGLGAKEVGDELIVDIRRYKEHPSCKTLFCFVYDPEGQIVNPRGLERDLSQEENDLTVRVFIAP